MRLVLNVNTPAGTLRLSKSRPVADWLVELPDGRQMHSRGSKDHAIARAVALMSTVACLPLPPIPRPVATYQPTLF
ncbi:hypothetical protein [Aureliella helgolandensis]|uniref:Uncharacterized protein n=1 Tax=Aureliella helgolandensis TaxID=2527968 RepID=A0A518G2Q1_9BACT|nr:hypothetical protein [Aureliella helgolandensis]QDV22881.1 hypothetical protein Q31a_11740 [Aureliella helgolandensis]